MKKRLFSMFLAFMLLFVAVNSLGENFDDDDFGDDFEDDWDDDWDDDWNDDWDDWDDETEPNIVENSNARLDEISGYKDIDYKKEGGFRFFISEDGTYSITDRYEGFDLNVTVPDMLGGLPVMSIGPNTFQDCKIEAVTLPETVTMIDRQAFFKCEGLKSITLPEGVVSIGYCAFAGCIALESIEIPESLETVDEFSFLNCLALTEVCFGENLKTIGPNAFTLCMALMRVVLPEGAEIDESAFTNCPADMVKEILS